MTEDWNRFLSVAQTDREGNRLNIIKVDGVDSADEKVIGKRLQEKSYHFFAIEFMENSLERVIAFFAISFLRFSFSINCSPPDVLGKS